MKITAITPQVKRPGRYSIFVDGRFAVGMNDTDLLTSGVRLNNDITQAELAKLKENSELSKIYDKTLNLLSFRPRSTWEIQDYLKRKKQPTEIIEKILNKLSDGNYLDDRKFAERWVENRRLLKPISSLKLRAELKQKRVPDDVISEVLVADETDELTVLKELVERKAARYPDKQKFMQYLARQGFRYDDIKTALNDR